MATKYNIDITKGSRYLKTFEYQTSAKVAIDLTGLDVRMQIRARENSTTPELELTTTNGRLTTTPLEGLISIVLTALETDALTISTGVYDLEIYDAGNTNIVDTILEGAVTINDGITR